MRYDPYLTEVVGQIPRLLGLLDRNVLSHTCGCFDRQYWHYKAIDFPCARMQEAVLTLSLLYRIEHQANPYYHCPLLLEWIRAALAFWAGMQHRDGTFSEWYPGEKSYVATAFSTFAASEALLLMKDEIADGDRVVRAIDKAGRWLSSRRESRVANQQTGAMIALYNAYLLTGQESHLKAARDMADAVTGSLTEEGWFYEYGGADTGYLSLSVDYMARYYQKSGDEKVLDALKSCTAFLSYFVHPNGTSGGEYASRNTEYLIPSGFEALSGADENSGRIAQHIRRSLSAGTSVSPATLDDRYLAYIGYNWLCAYLSSRELQPCRQRYEDNMTIRFDRAGIDIYSDPFFYLIMSRSRGGAFKLFFRASGRSLYDSGVSVVTGKGRLTSGLAVRHTGTGEPLKASGPLAIVNEKAMTPLKTIGLRVFQLTAGKNSHVSRFMKERMRDLLISDVRPSAARFSRDITIGADNVVIKDTVTNARDIEELLVSCKASYTFIPSSRYFQPSELESVPVRVTRRELDGRGDEVAIFRTYDRMGNPVGMRVE